jgi:hypothetical protein
VIGGTFSHYNGVPRNGLARVNADGSLDETFQPGTGINGDNARVNALATGVDGTLYLGGSFTHFNDVPRQSLAAAYNNPRLYDVAHNGGQSSVSFLSLLDRTYTLEFKQSLDDPGWTTVTTINGDGTTKVLTDINAAGTARLYRIRVE